MRRRFIALVLFASVTTMFVAEPVVGDDITVTDTLDSVNGGDGLTSLREAFNQASAGVGDDVITLAGGATYMLSSCLASQLSDTGADREKKGVGDK